MQYHVVYSLPGAYIYKGPDPQGEHTFDTFEDARNATIADLEHWQSKLQSNLQELRDAKSINDLHYTEDDDA